MANLLGPATDGPARLRALLAQDDGPVVAPGAYDALSARLVEAAGFPAVYMTGFGVTASLIGRPDVGLLTMTEMTQTARRIRSAVDVPVIADADTGYGNALNVIRTVGEYEAAGVAGIHLEDQVAPKRCGHLEGKEVIAAGTMVDRIRAAVAARRNPDFLLIARTDARAVEGLAAAIERGKRYRDAGADMLFVEAPQSDAEIETVATELAGVPLLFNWAEGGRTPPTSLARLRELGFALVICPIAALLAATRAVREVVARIAEDGTPVNVVDSLPEFTEFAGIGEVEDIGREYGRG
ncbi:MAG TPA: oxaloacetate decarboxylase [Pseudonocardiaceae bacterium]|jgi:2-methylisocitrate lyase-like PEP mutase family enzyme|nr:oxaloacetate decarboxylase [Pseudonocardiaceae bacterium]